MRKDIVCLWIAIAALIISTIMNQIHIMTIHNARIEQEQMIIDSLIRMKKHYDARLKQLEQPVEPSDFYEFTPKDEWY